MNLLRINKEVHPIYWTHNFLSDEEIQKIIKYTEDLQIEDAKVGVNIQEEEKKPFTLDCHIKNPNLGNVPRTRITNIKWIELNSNTNWLYKKIINQIHKVNQENFDMILKFVENLQFSEYTESQRGFYAKHDDCGNSGRIESFADIRKLSFSIQLSDEKEYEGGELIFYKNGKEKVAPKSKGTIIFFESNIQHEVKPVKKGTRHALVSWVQGPNLR
jgi:PKHD-type hydroxylase